MQPRMETKTTRAFLRDYETVVLYLYEGSKAERHNCPYSSSQVPFVSSLEKFRGWNSAVALADLDRAAGFPRSLHDRQRTTVVDAWARRSTKPLAGSQVRYLAVGHTQRAAFSGRMGGSELHHLQYDAASVAILGRQPHFLVRPFGGRGPCSGWLFWRFN